MTVKEMGGRVDWKALIAMLGVAGMLITIVMFTSSFQSRIAKVDELNVALLESKADRSSMHIDIATLKECARNTETKLILIEAKLDRIIERNQKIDGNGRGK